MLHAVCDVLRWQKQRESFIAGARMTGLESFHMCVNVLEWYDPGQRCSEPRTQYLSPQKDPPFQTNQARGHPLLDTL